MTPSRHPPVTLPLGFLRTKRIHPYVGACAGVGQVNLKLPNKVLSCAWRSLRQ